MADFCADCTEDTAGREYRDRNDMRHEGEPFWTLCEGCGIHLFKDDGRRICFRPQSDFHHESGEAEWTPQWPETCPDCLGLEYGT